MLFQFAGGLGIFLFGIKYMGDGLQQSAGDNLREILNRFTSTPLRSVLAGIVVTALIQSSSGTTVLAVGLVSAGFMTLKQAIGVIMGANVGTTVTAFIIGINLGAYALPIIAVGAFCLFFSKRQFINNFGQIAFGFGALFYGLELMGKGMAPLQESPVFADLMLKVADQPILGVGIGTLLTMVLQSSSATVGILQQLYAQGSVTLQAALPILFGDNIGTTITAVLAALGASVAARRTAGSHVIFNLVGAVIFTVLLQPFTYVITNLSGYLGLNPEMQIAFAHGIFNLSNLLIQFWFINQIAYLVTKLVPGKESIIQYNSHLDTRIMQTAPSMALNQAKQELIQMGHFVEEEFKATFNYYEKQKDGDQTNALQLEEAVDNFDRRLTEYLMKLSTVNLTNNENEEQTSMMEMTKDFERMGDHCENIMENIQEAVRVEKKQLAKDKKEGKKSSREGKVLFDDDMVNMFNKVGKNIHDAIQAYESGDTELAQKIMKREEQINAMERLLRKKYTRMLNDGTGRPSDGILFVDIASNLERVSDHAAHIAEHVLGIRHEYQTPLIEREEWF
ncbi:phosphate:Na+ symporter [Isobaculum melis]|uniref:Phosphate:Na+ symporter n=2 Tax=Isobaculum melis TaxID=142588 RepID=A0A1H9QGE1_9LACT|nr:phosphate:Na+ symporter [Isobaculum melis]